ncbi:Phage tail tape measure family protein [Tenacibaculum maritimum]|nr:Phage tail tape measure family protein [Tenacibaculum maritimum]
MPNFEHRFFFMANTVVTKGVITINGKEIANTWSALRKETQKLKRELKKIPEGTDEFIKKAKELENAEKHFKAVDDSIKNVNVSLDEANEYFSKFIGGLSSGNYKQAEEGLRGIILNFKGLVKSARAFIATPFGIAITAISAIAIGTKKWFDYNQELSKTTKLTKQLTNLSGQDLTNHRDMVSGIAKTNKKSFDEIVKAADSLSEQMKIPQQRALDLINQGFVRGADLNGDFLQKIKEYPIQFKNAGYSAQDFIDIATQEVKGGVYDDKLIDALKEADLSLKEFTKTQEDALKNAFGDDYTQKLKEGLATGEISTKKAIQSIIKESSKVGLNFKQQQQLIADVFKGAGEDAGGFAEIVRQLNEAFKEENRTLDELEVATQRVADANIRYEKALSDFFDASQSGFPEFLANWKAFGTEVLSGILENLKRIFTTQEQLINKAKNLGKNNAANQVSEDIGRFGGKIGDEVKYKIQEADANIKRVKKKIKEVGFELFGNTKEILNEKLAEQIAYRDELLKIANGTSELFFKAEEKRKKIKKKKNNDKKAPTSARKDNSLKNAITEREKANKRLLQLQQKLEDEKMLIKEESLQKQLELLDIAYRRKKEKFELENKTLQKEIEATNIKISSLQNKKSKTKNTDKQEYYNKAIKELDLLNKTRVQAKKVNDEILVQLESTKQFKIATLREKSFVKDIERERKKIDKEKELTIDKINTISTFEEAKQKLQDQYGVKDLSKIKNIVDAKNKLREEANKGALQQQVRFLEKSASLLHEQLKTVTGPAADQLKENLRFLEEKLTKIKGFLQGKQDEESSDTNSTYLGDEAGSLDVLGFSSQQWVDTFDNLDTTENKLIAVGMAMQALANAGRMYAQFQEQENQRELRLFAAYQDRRKKVLKNQLDSGILTQEEYHREVDKLEKEAANKKADLEYKQAKANKIANLFQAMGSTAVAVATALKAGPIAGPILAAIVGALGAVQIGLIASQPLPPKPTYEVGGYTKGLGFKDETGYEVAGVVHGNEYVVPEWLLEEPQVANIVQWIEAKRTKTTNSFDDGGYTENAKDTTYEANSELSTDSNLMMVYAVNRLYEILDKLERNGIEAFLLADGKNGKLMHDAVKKFKTIENKNKR